MLIRLTVPHDLVSAETLGAALEASTRVAQVERRKGLVPSIEDGIRAGVRWRPEPPGDESFDIPSTVLARKWGDCDDLAPWRTADLRTSGEDPRARAIAIPSGPNKWHAIVRRSDGSREDPSKWAGMPHTVVGQAAPTLEPLRLGRASVLIGQGQGVRIDVPGRHAMTRACPMGYAVTVREPDASSAVRAAITGAVRLGMCSGIAHPRALSLLRALYRFLCQSEDIQQALALEGLSGGEDRRHLEALAGYAAPGASRRRDPLAIAAARIESAFYGPRDEVGILPCLAVVGAVAAGVAAVVGAVTPIVRAVLDAINATTKLVVDGVKPVEDLYKQVRAAVDQGTIEMEHVRRTADELRAQGHGAEADKLTRDAMVAQEAKNAREVQALVPGVVSVTELSLRNWRLALKTAVEQAAAGDVAGARARAAGVKADVLGQPWLPAPGPATIWESLALAYGLDPSTATPPGGGWDAPAARKAYRPGAHPGVPPPAPGPAPRAAADDGDFVTPGIDALFRRAGAFM